MKTLRYALVALAAAAAVSAEAATPFTFQTASFTDYSASGEPGGYFIDSTRYIGASFTLTQATDITSIGGYFSMYSADSIFGAIVSLSSLTATPKASIDSLALAHVVFTPTGTDETDAITAHLAAGTYAVVFGSGLYGTTGYSALVSGQDGTARNLFAGVGSAFTSFADTDIRITVNGTVAAVPEPESWALMAAGLLSVGLLLRRGRKNG